MQTIGAAGLVADQHLQPAAPAARLVGLDHLAGDHGALTDGRLRHRPRRAAVLVSAGQVQEQIADRGEPLRSQLLSQRRSNAAQSRTGVDSGSAGAFGAGFFGALASCDMEGSWHFP